MTTVTLPGLRMQSARAFVSLRNIFRLIFRDRFATIGLAIILVFVIVAAFAPFLAPYPSEGAGQSNLANRLQPPSFAHPFGTDDFGRDLLSRVMFGAQIALLVGVLTVAIAFPVGVVLGVVAGYYRGKTEETTMRVTDMFLAFPPILLAFVIAASLGRGILAIIIAIAASFWPWYTRLIYTEVRKVRQQPFVEAAAALGLPGRRILFREVLPNALAPAAVQASMDIGSAILIAAALSWLGLGPPPPTPDWGVMFNNAYLSGSLITYWWIGLFLGLSLFLLVLAFNLVGDGLRDVLDPKLRRRRILQ